MNLPENYRVDLNDLWERWNRAAIEPCSNDIQWLLELAVATRAYDSALDAYIYDHSTLAAGRVNDTEVVFKALLAMDTS